MKRKDKQPPKTVINPLGELEIIEEAYNKLTIDPDDPRTGDSCLRYNVTARLLGRLERLAKSRFEIRKLTDKDIDEWRNVDDESHWEIAQSVNASSEIENEHIRADELSLVLAAVTGTEDRVVTEELSARAVAVKSIYETYLWALTLDRKTYMDFDLVLEIHSRMFVTTRPELAGQLKSKDVSIKGAGYDVKTLPPAKVPTFMRALCKSTNKRLLKASRHAEESMLLIIAEFILDFLAIHPFADGNGRTARLLSTYLLERAGYHFARFYPLDSIILENRDEYYRVLFESQKNWQTEDEDISPWIEFYVNAIYSQYIRAYQRVLDNFDPEVVDEH